MLKLSNSRYEFFIKCSFLSINNCDKEKNKVSSVATRAFVAQHPAPAGVTLHACTSWCNAPGMHQLVYVPCLHQMVYVPCLYQLAYVPCLHQFVYVPCLHQLVYVLCLHQLVQCSMPAPAGIILHACISWCNAPCLQHLV